MGGSHLYYNTSMIKVRDPLQILQIWFSSSFPIGSYAYSHGLESLIDNKKLKIDVIEFLEAVCFMEPYVMIIF